MTIGSFFQRIEKLAVDNSPTILTTIGVIGTLTTAYLTGKATFKAAEILYDYTWVPLNEGKPDVPFKEKVSLVWKEYIPPLVTGALTIAAIVTANRVSSRRATALAIAYSLSEKAFDEYREKIVEKLGPKKEQAARDELAQERFGRETDRQVLFTGTGEVLCHEAYTGRVFMSDMETLRQARNEINFEILHNFSASLTDFYHKIGLPRTDISDEVGWNSDKIMELQFSSVLTTDGKPAVSFTYSVTPIRRYYKIN